ncbi:hypothetical protein A0H81_02719 [Grifola frondosa]|uniref:Uncharacterized protein n=1 Tax=Grifola frondosa TaxID=5627 RepID=A0A1C7MMV5_GRIFR|nr:hypothetical protein A0H81_02719 [Grifola frondosa]
MSRWTMRRWKKQDILPDSSCPCCGRRRPCDQHSSPDSDHVVVYTFTNSDEVKNKPLEKTRNGALCYMTLSVHWQVHMV